MKTTIVHQLFWVAASSLLMCACGGRAVTEEASLSSFEGYLVSGCWDAVQASAPQIQPLEPGADTGCQTDLWLVPTADASSCPDFRSPGPAMLTSTCFFDEEQLPANATSPGLTRVKLRGRRVSGRICFATAKCLAEEPGCLACETRDMFIPE